MKNKTTLLGIIALVLLPNALADYGGMMGTGIMGLYGLYGIIWFAVAAFVFSVIFWYVYKLIIKEKSGRLR